MPAISASAPGKSILFGEHAVVYGQPAIAVPVNQVQARVVVQADPKSQPGEISISSSSIGLNSGLVSLPEEHPFSILFSRLQIELGIPALPAMRLSIHSTIPMAAGLGSGAAVSIAILRAVSRFLGMPLDNEQISRMAFEVEKRYHGNPSGIDNTVITYAQPVYYQRGQPFTRLKVVTPFSLVIADTGIRCLTSDVVGDVRQSHDRNPNVMDKIFEAIGDISRKARQAIETGQNKVLGTLMNENHILLQQLGVSSDGLDCLATAALDAGAEGAKMCGAGRGGIIIALVPEKEATRVAKALDQAGSVRTIITHVENRKQAVTC